MFENTIKNAAFKKVIRTRLCILLAIMLGNAFGQPGDWFGCFLGRLVSGDPVFSRFRPGFLPSAPSGGSIDCVPGSNLILVKFAEGTSWDEIVAWRKKCGLRRTSSEGIVPIIERGEGESFLWLRGKIVEESVCLVTTIERGLDRRNSTFCDCYWYFVPSGYISYYEFYTKGYFCGKDGVDHRFAFRTY